MGRGEVAVMTRAGTGVIGATGLVKLWPLLPSPVRPQLFLGTVFLSFPHLLLSCSLSPRVLRVRPSLLFVSVARTSLSIPVRLLGVGDLSAQIEDLLTPSTVSNPSPAKRFLPPLPRATLERIHARLKAPSTAEIGHR